MQSSDNGNALGVWRIAVVALIAIMAAFSLVCVAGCMSPEKPSAVSIVSEDDSQSSSASESASQSGGSSASASSAAASSSVSGPDGSQQGAMVQECDLFRLALTDDMGYKLQFEQPYPNCLVAKCGDMTVFEIAAYDTFESRPTEWKLCRYDCGSATDGSSWHPVTAVFYYESSSGSGNTHWGDKPAGTLGVESLAGITPEEILACLDLRVSTTGETRAQWERCEPVFAGGDEVVSSSTAQSPASSADSAPAAFWGVWDYASKDEAEAEEFAAQARANGWPNAGVYLTTDWSNLNAEPWYVVTLDVCASQSDAESAATRAQSNGYDGAYAKYTGDYIG